MRQSIGLSPAAATRTRSSPAPGVGRGISHTDNFSGGPYSANVAASKLNPPPPNGTAKLPGPPAMTSSPRNQNGGPGQLQPLVMAHADSLCGAMIRTPRDD